MIHGPEIPHQCKQVWVCVDLLLNSNQEFEWGHLTSTNKHDTNMAWIIAISSGLLARPRPTMLLPPLSNGKTRGC